MFATEERVCVLHLEANYVFSRTNKCTPTCSKQKMISGSHKLVGMFVFPITDCLLGVGQ